MVYLPGGRVRLLQQGQTSKPTYDVIQIREFPHRFVFKSFARASVHLARRVYVFLIGSRQTRRNFEIVNRVFLVTAAAIVGVGLLWFHSPRHATTPAPKTTPCDTLQTDIAAGYDALELRWISAMTAAICRSLDAQESEVLEKELMAGLKEVRAQREKAAAEVDKLCDQGRPVQEVSQLIGSIIAESSDAMEARLAQLEGPGTPPPVDR